jgi:hypothetical protein
VALHTGRQAGLFHSAVLAQDGAAPGQVHARGARLGPPSTMPALAALSLMVSNTLRMTLVWRSNCSMRASMISIAGCHVLGGVQHVVDADPRCLAAGP